MCEQENWKAKLAEILAETRRGLDDCVEFWLQHSVDTDCGGFYNCIDSNGDIYDCTKYGWLQGRQVWMLAKLYNEVPRFHRDYILKAAEHGAVFLQNKIMSSLCNGAKRCYFAVTRTGQPIKMQRTIFTESFYTIAMSEMFRATGAKAYMDEAVAVLEKILFWSFQDDTELGRSSFTNDREQSRPLNVPLIILGILEELYSADESLVDKYMSTSNRCVELLMSYRVQVGNSKFIHENVGSSGEILPGSEGHLLNPGHAIEAGWFLIQYGQRFRDDKVIQNAIDDFILQPLRYGWDKEMGGIYYFLDSRGYSPIQLEWNMKLWWPHCEALIALIMSFEKNRSQEILDLFLMVYHYFKTHFLEEKRGECFGYLNQQGQVSSRFKGGPFKGCFHFPRSLMQCEKTLEKLLSTVSMGLHS